MIITEVYENALDRHIAYRRESIEKPLARLRKIPIGGNSDIIHDLLSQIALHQEILALDMRNDLLKLYQDLVNYGMEKRYYPLPAAPDIKTLCENGAFQIELDALLPFHTNGSVFYLHQKLDYALSKYRQENDLPIPIFLERCAVVFIHHYNMKHKGRQLRDYDNMERRCILNVVARYFLIDDSPQCYISMDTIIPDDRTYTEIRIMSIPQFQEYIANNHILPKELV